MSATKKLLIATTNVKKRGEMAQILSEANLDFELVTLEAYPDYHDVEETGETFLENAVLKAVAATKYTGLLSIADDGGLSIDALDGAPGVKSHRFLGENTPFEVKNARVLEMLQDVPEEKRTARFQCAVVIATPEGQRYDCTGVCEGRIGYEMRGSFGFGYDPIFRLLHQDVHMAELPPEEKHKISHRGKALVQAVEVLRTCTEL